MIKIDSRQNQKIKKYLKLFMKKYRDLESLYIAYGNDFLQDAIKYDLVVDILSSKESDNPTLLLDKKLMKEFQKTETEIEPIIICKKSPIKTLLSDKILAFDNIQDPRNAGALLRSALAFGFKTVIFSKNSVDPYNEKTTRVSKASIFGLNIIQTDLKEMIVNLKQQGYKIIGADSNSDNHIIKKEEKIVLVMGNEGNGLSNDIKELLDYSYSIDTNDVESLNVSVAGSIIMYEWR